MLNLINKIKFFLNFCSHFFLKNLKKKTHINEFPLNVDILGHQKPFLGSSKENGFFTRIYNEPIKNWSFLNNFYIKDVFHSFKSEIIWGKKTKKIDLDLDFDYVIPISNLDKNEPINININSKKYDVILPNDRFYHLSVKKNEKLTVESKYNFVACNLVKKKDFLKNKSKLTLVLFVDGLINIENFNLGNMKDVMPNTQNFFKNGAIFKKHFANDMWSLPSAGTFFSGKYHQGHRLFHPNKADIVGKNYPILSEVFQKQNYYTFSVNGSWRLNPLCGFAKGFDRTIYKRSMNCSEVVNEFFDGHKSFKERNQFVWLSLFDTHMINHLPDIESQINFSPQVLTKEHSIKKKTKSVLFKYDKDQIKKYVHTLKRIDFYLGILFDYIKKNYNYSDYLVTMVSDHGQSFVDDEDFLLRNARTHVPWMIAGSDIAAGEVHDISENVDVFNSIIKKSGIENCPDNDGILPKAIGGEFKKEYTFAQNIQPGDNYKAAIRDQNFEFRFESESIIKDNGMFDPEPFNYKLFKIFKNEIVKNKEIEEKYLNICKLKINDWLKKCN